MRIAIVVFLCGAVSLAEIPKPEVNWSVIDQQMAALQSAIQSHDIEAVKKATDAFTKVTMQEWQKNLTTPAEFLQRAEQRAAANPASRTGSLPYLASLAYRAGDLIKADQYARESLQSPSVSGPMDTIHISNNVLGLIALQHGDLPAAKSYLSAAGKTKGSSTLVKYGPNLALAKALLDKGQNDAVLGYFQDCRKFVTQNPKLDDWIALLKEGRSPDLSHEYLWAQ